MRALKPASAPYNESWLRNSPSSGSAGCPKSSASNHRWAKPAANRRPSPMSLSNGWPPPASGSHPSWRSTNTSRDAGSKISSPTAKTSFAPSSPGPAGIPLPPSGRDENNCSIPASGGPVGDPQGYRIQTSEVSSLPEQRETMKRPWGWGSGLDRVFCWEYS